MTKREKPTLKEIIEKLETFDTSHQINRIKITLDRDTLDRKLFIVAIDNKEKTYMIDTTF